MKPSDRRRYESYVNKEMEAFEREELRRYDKNAGYQTNLQVFLSVVTFLGLIAAWIFKATLAVVAAVAAFCFTFVTSAVKAFRESRRR